MGVTSSREWVEPLLRLAAATGLSPSTLIDVVTRRLEVRRESARVSMRDARFDKREDLPHLI